MGWSDLPSDLVISIATRLPDPGDVVRFRAVCRSWKSASRGFRPAKFFPWLAVIPENYDPAKDELSFISHAANDCIYKLTMPPPHNICSSVAVKDDWMMFVVREILVPIIVDPPTGAQLPCLPSFYTFLDHQRLGRLWEDLDFVFFLSDYLFAFAECLVDGRHILAVATLGDDEWSVIRLSSSFPENGIRSIVFHEADCKFYAMHCDGHMQSFRLDRSGGKTVFSEVSDILAEATGWHKSVSHLVSDGNNLLRVRKYLRSKKFDMLKYCPDADMWVKVMNMDLGDNSLFFDFFGARLLPLSQGDGSPQRDRRARRNCIYFTDYDSIPPPEGANKEEGEEYGAEEEVEDEEEEEVDEEEEEEEEDDDEEEDYQYVEEEEEGYQYVHYVRIYDVDKGTVEPCFSTNVQSKNRQPAHMWFMPSLYVKN